MSPTIQSPAPAFSVTALVDGAFKRVSTNGTYPSFFSIGALFLTRLCKGDPDVLPSVNLCRSPQACTIRLICCPPKGLHFYLPNRAPCIQRRARRLCTH